IRLVDDPKAPAYRKVDPDASHPHRLKELVTQLNTRLAGGTKVTAFDVQCVRKVYQIDKTKPQYFYKSRFTSPQYSDAFLEWMAEQVRTDHHFFYKARLTSRRGA